MKPVVVWLARPEAKVVHRPSRVGLTACGISTKLGRSQSGTRIDWQLLDPAKVRLCRRCWNPIAVKHHEELLDMSLPPCERAS